MRQQTYWMVAPYMKQGHGYRRFQKDWQFGWETINLPDFKPLSPAEVETIAKRHHKYLKRKK